MARKKRKAPSINSSSSADLAFTLLIFFLVVTSMDTDEGLARLLPRWVPEDMIQDTEINKRNILNVMVNKDDQILLGEDFIDGRLSVQQQNEKLRKTAKEFITATGNFSEGRGPELNDVDPEKNPEVAKYILPKDPNVKISKKGVISLQSDYGTSYEKYIQIQNELVAAYNELRQEAAQKYFKKDYSEEGDLSEDEIKALKDLYPMNISEANAKY